MSKLCFGIVLWSGVVFCVRSSENVWFSRPSELGSPRLENHKREIIFARTARSSEGSEFWATGYLVQASASRLSKKSRVVKTWFGAFRPGERFSPKQELEFGFVYCLTRRLGEGDEVRRREGSPMRDRLA